MTNPEDVDRRHLPDEFHAARRIIEKYVDGENQTADEYTVAQAVLRLRFALFRLGQEDAFADDQARRDYANRMIDGPDGETVLQTVTKALFTAWIPTGDHDQVGYLRALAKAALLAHD